MNEQKVQFYHAQAAKLNQRRKWQSMAIWPIVYRFGDRLKMEFEFQHGPFKIDLYIPCIKLAVEIDEPFHDRQQEDDIARQGRIASDLGCDFVRVRVKDPGKKSLFQQVEQLCGDIQHRIEQLKPQEWDIKPKKVDRITPSRESGYSQANQQALEEANIPDRVQEMMKDLAALGLDVSKEMGPVSPSNGELGFSIVMPGIKFCVSVRANEKAKLLVTQYSETALQRLGITLDGPKLVRGNYWVINETKGRFDIDTVMERLVTFKQLLDR